MLETSWKWSSFIQFYVRVYYPGRGLLLHCQRLSPNPRGCLNLIILVSLPLVQNISLWEPRTDHLFQLAKNVQGLCILFQYLPIAYLCGWLSAKDPKVKEVFDVIGLFSSVHFSHSIVSDSFSSVQFSHSVVSDSLRPHESQHARPPCSKAPKTKQN